MHCFLGFSSFASLEFKILRKYAAKAACTGTSLFAPHGCGKRLIYKPFFAMTLILLVPHKMRSQVHAGAVADNMTSTPVLGIGHDYIKSLNEVVNPANGSLTIRITAPAPKERGFNEQMNAFTYSSSASIAIHPSFSAQEQPSQSGYQFLLGFTSFTVGAAFNEGNAIMGQQDAPDTTALPPEGALTWNSVSMTANVSQSCHYTNNFVYTDFNGNAHNLPMIWMLPANNYVNQCGFWGAFPDPGIHSGTDGPIIGILSGQYASIYDAHGRLLHLQYSNQMEDTNGNYADGTGRSYSTVNIPGLGAPYSFRTRPNSNTAGALTYQPNATRVSGSDMTYCPATITNTSQIPTNDYVIGLPNGQSYVFGMDSAYGLVNKVTYPNGATVSYTWANNYQSDQTKYYSPGGDMCIYNLDMPGIKRRVVSFDGTTSALQQDFTYSTNWDAPGGVDYKTTTVVTTDLKRPGGAPFRTVYTYNRMTPAGLTNAELVFGPAYPSPIPVEHTIKYYDTNGLLLNTVTKVWSKSNEMDAECTTLPNGKTSGIFYTYGPGMVLIDKKEFDYGQVQVACALPSTTPVRETQTTIQPFGYTPYGSALGQILDRPQSVKIYDKGVLFAETDFTYDEYAVSAVLPAPINHDETLYGPTSTAPRGNVTTITKRCLQAGCADQVTHLWYDETGQIVKLQDGNQNYTSYSYTDSYTGYGSASGNTNTYVTTVTGPQVNNIQHIDHYSYGFTNGKMLSHTDDNTKTTSYCYNASGCGGSTADPWARLTEVDYPDGGGTVATFIDSGTYPATIVSTALSSSTSHTVRTDFDSYGQQIDTVDSSDPEGTDQTATTHDGLGRIYTSSNPYRNSSEATAGITTYTYDALGRPIQVLKPDGNSETTTYSNNTAFSKDEKGNQWARTIDAFGRLSSVVEPNGFSTTYTYDAGDRLTSVMQSGLATRSFLYNSLGELVVASNPEVGTICYGNQTAQTATLSTCTGGYDGNGNLLIKTDARGQTVSYLYDALNRVYSKIQNGVEVAHYYYDGTYASSGQNPYSGVDPNLVGRVSMTHTYNPDANSTDDQFFGYDALGRLKYWTDIPPSETGTPGHVVQARYDLAGNLTDLTYPDGSQVTNHFNAAGRLDSVKKGTSGSSGDPYVSSISYSAAGIQQQVVYGNGVIEKLTQNNRLQPCENYVFLPIGSGGTMVFDRQYSYSVGGTVATAQTPGTPCGNIPNNNGNIGYIVDATNPSATPSQTQSFSYDALNRLTTWDTPSMAGQARHLSFLYDLYGNVLQTASNASGSTGSAAPPTVAPTVTLSFGEISGSGASANVTTMSPISNYPASIQGFHVSAGGSGYSNPKVTISGNLASGYLNQQTASATVVNGVITNVSKTGPTVKYMNIPSVSIFDLAPTSASGTVTLTVGGVSETVPYDQTSNSSTLASAMMTAIGEDSNFPLMVSSISGYQLVMQVKSGSSTYPLSVSVQASVGGNLFVAQLSATTVAGASTTYTPPSYPTGYTSSTWPYDSANHFVASSFQCSPLVAGQNIGYDAAGNTSCAGLQNSNAEAFVWDSESRLSQVWSEQNNNTYNKAARYMYSAQGDRIRSEQYALGTNTIQSWREYSFFNGGALAEKDQTGAWTNYIYANGRKIARVESLEHDIHLQASGTNGQELRWTIPAPQVYTSLGVTSGYTIKTGDKLYWRQWQSPQYGGIRLRLSCGGTCTATTDALADATSVPVNKMAVTSTWTPRYADLSAYNGQQITATELVMDASSPTGTWIMYFGDISILSVDGTVTQLAPREGASVTPVSGYSVAGSIAESGSFLPAAGVAGANNRTTFYVADHLGTTSLELSGWGWPIWRGEFAPFGQELSDPATTANRYKFTGKERDTESGLDYFGARFMNSNVGRFITPDWSAKLEPVPYSKLEDPQSLNLYAYAGNNPITQSDFDGHSLTPIRWAFPIGDGEPSTGNTIASLAAFAMGMHLNPFDVIAQAQQQVSQAGQDFIKGYEKLSLTVYDASKGKVKGGDWTIGYGHKTTKGAGPITLPEAEALFQSDVARMASHVSADLNVPVNQNQFDALVSLRFNAGANAITPPVSDLNSTGHATMGDFTNHYITAGGVPMRGLELRRAAEWRIFNEGVYDASH